MNLFLFFTSVTLPPSALQQSKSADEAITSTLPELSRRCRGSGSHRIAFGLHTCLELALLAACIFARASVVV